MAVVQHYPKRLIEVDLPIRRISNYARGEQSVRPGHIKGLHIWWARRPLAACRAVVCAALWPDPVDEACPEAFRVAARQSIAEWTANHLALVEPESYSRFIAIQKDPNLLENRNTLRGALLDFIADFSKWENSNVSAYVSTCQALTRLAHESLGGGEGSRPLVVDPFAGGGAIPLECLRVGADAFSSDLNPIPVLLNKVIMEYVPKYGQRLIDQIVESAGRLGQDVEGALHRNYFTKSVVGEKPQVFFWARTIACEGPGCGCQFPLLRSLWLRRKSERGVAFQLSRAPRARELLVSIINPSSAGQVGSGTSKQGAATCPLCGYTTPVERVREQLSKRQGGAVDAMLLAVGVTKQGQTGKSYRAPTEDELHQAERSRADYLKLKVEDGLRIATIPNEELNHLRGFFNVVLYGMKRWGDLFNPRQAILMATITELIRQEHSLLKKSDAGFADAVATCLALVAGKVAQYNSSCCRWKSTGETVVDMFGRQALPMVWDFVEAYPFCRSTGDMRQYVDSFCTVLRSLSELKYPPGVVVQSSATSHPLPDDAVDAFITDPPYYDAIPYADLSDFFYVWLRRMLAPVHPQLFAEDLSPKSDECVALSHRAAMYRHKDRRFFERMMTAAASEGRRCTKEAGIGVVVFANKSTSGWEAMLNALIEAGWIVTASWPIDTEMSSRLRAQDSAVLGSSVHLVCRPREVGDHSPKSDEVGDWRDVLQELPVRIHEWMPRLAEEGVVGADSIFACLGPALEIFSRYSKVEKANGETVALAEYLEQVWAAVAREALTMVFEEADASGFEADARLTAMWLWTLKAGQNGNPATADEMDDEEADQDDEAGGKKPKVRGFVLEYDAVRKIAQGLGANLEALRSIVEVSGGRARLLPVSDRTAYLFGKEETESTRTRRKKKSSQMDLFSELAEIGDDEAAWPGQATPRASETTLDRVHQSMILFATGRGEALRRFLVEEGVGQDGRFWRLAQALSALFPATTEEKRWVDGVLARKKGLGF